MILINHPNDPNTLFGNHLRGVPAGSADVIRRLGSLFISQIKGHSDNPLPQTLFLMKNQALL